MAVASLTSCLSSRFGREARAFARFFGLFCLLCSAGAICGRRRPKIELRENVNELRLLGRREMTPMPISALCAPEIDHSASTGQGFSSKTEVGVTANGVRRATQPTKSETCSNKSRAHVIALRAVGGSYYQVELYPR